MVRAWSVFNLWLNNCRGQVQFNRRARGDLGSLTVSGCCQQMLFNEGEYSVYAFSITLCGGLKIFHLALRDSCLARQGGNSKTGINRLAL